MKTQTALVTLMSLVAGCATTSEGVRPPDPDPYTVVWDTPSLDANGSMPLGNGDLAINLWAEADGDLLFYLSKSDAWSENARLLKLGRVRVSLDPSPFTAGAFFRQTLDARTGAIRIEAGPEDSRIHLRVWVDAHYPAVRVEADSQVPCTMRIQLEPWRTAPRELGEAERFSAYGLISSPDPVVVQPDTIVEDAGDRVIWFHHNTSSIWADGLRRQHMAHWIDRGDDPLLHRTFGGLIQGEGFVRAQDTALRSSAPRRRHRATVYALTARTSDPADWRRRVRALAEADSNSGEAAFAAHQRWWRAFWDRSWVHLSPAAGASEKTAQATRTVTRGYALQRFITACAARGAMPVKFNGSLFTVDATVDGERFDADYRRWGGPYWFQNTRLIYWPMLASGDFDMMEPLFRMFSDALPFASDRTRTYFGHAGAFFPETMYFWGAYANDNYGWNRKDLPIGVTENRYIRYHYDGALELLALMLDHYAFTQDDAFLTRTLLPFGEAIPAFFFEHYPPGKSGKMRIAPSQALETWQKAVDPAPPIAGLRRVLHDLLALPQHLTTPEQRDQWRAISEALPSLPTGGSDGTTVLTAAAEILEEARNSENPELYAIFPYKLYGVGKPDLELARQTFKRRRVRGSNGWRQDDTQAAVLGLAGEASARLSERMAMKNPESRFPAFWGPNFDWIPDQDHGGNALMALQHMLLQTDGRRILLFPAWPKDWNVDFKLHAPYKTTVSGALRDGHLTGLRVTPESRRADVVIMDTQ